MRSVLLVTAAVLAAALAGCLGADEAPPETASTPEADPSTAPDATAPDPPTPDPSTPTRWQAQACTGISLVWTPPAEDLDPLVGPWTPAEGPVPGRGVFVLFAVECPDSTVAGNATGPVRTGAAIVPIQAPADGPDAPDDTGWIAIPETVAPEGPVHGLWEDHAFPMRQGDVSVDVQRGDGGGQASMTYETPNGTVEAQATFDGAAEDEAFTTAIVTPARDPTGVAVGPEERTRYTGDGLVSAEGETWVSRLDLAPSPFSVAVDTDFSWDFGFRVE